MKHTITLKIGELLLTATYVCNSIKKAVEMARNEFNFNNYTLLSCRVKSK